jgi:hypothetical protein
LLDAAECPDELLHVWIWFCLIPSPLTYTEIKSWCDLTGNTPTADEVELLMLANNIYQRVQYG